MKLGNLSKIITALTVATTFQLFSTDKILADNDSNKAFKIIGLTPNNTLVSFGSDSRRSKDAIRVTGIDGNLLGIDFRPANGKLYGVTDTDKIYTINPKNGAATFVSTLSMSFNGGFQSGFDFNPAIDRLRLTGSNDQSFAVNVDTGLVATGGNLNYASGVDPNITGSAYTNSFAGLPSTTRTTMLYGIDYDLDVLATQNPMTGTLTTVGPLGVNFAPIAGFDIFTSADGKNTGFAVSGSRLYTIDLSTGTVKKLGNLPTSGFIGLAVTSAR